MRLTSPGSEQPGTRLPSAAVEQEDLLTRPYADDVEHVVRLIAAEREFLADFRERVNVESPCAFYDPIAPQKGTSMLRSPRCVTP